MRLQFLGTSAGAPSRSRNVTGLALGFDQRSDWYLFDCGEATQHQLLRANFSPARLSKIFITHMHGDHIFGLPGLLTSRSMTGGTVRPLSIYGPKGIREYVESSLRLSASHLTFDIEYHEFSKAGQLYANEKEDISTVRLSHNVPSFAYVVKEAERPGVFDVDKAKALGVPSGPMLGELSQGRDVTLDDGTVVKAMSLKGPVRRGRKIIIGGDNEKPELLIPALSGADIFIHEATLIESVRDKVKYNVHHSTAKAVASAAKAAGTPNLILTHISARFGTENQDKGLTVRDIINEARSEYGGELHIARDFDTFELNRDGVLTLVQSL